MIAIKASEELVRVGAFDDGGASDRDEFSRFATKRPN